MRQIIIQNKYVKFSNRLPIILNFVYIYQNYFQPPKGFAWEQTTTTRKTPTTTEDIVIFEKDKPVSLELDDKLFGSSFTLVTNLSTTVGDYMIVSEN